MVASLVGITSLGCGRRFLSTRKVPSLSSFKSQEIDGLSIVDDNYRTTLTYNAPILANPADEKLDPAQIGQEYPQNIPFTKFHKRNPHSKYWWPNERRNFDEPIHEQDEVLNMYSAELPNTISGGRALFQNGVFFASILALVGVVYISSDLKKPFTPQKYPFNNLYKEYGGYDNQVSSNKS